MNLNIIISVSLLSALGLCQPDNVMSALQELESMPQCGVSHCLPFRDGDAVFVPPAAATHTLITVSGCRRPACWKRYLTRIAQ